MDFQSMKRKELQALCKKHKIPANLSNLEMANKLKEFFEGKENSLMQGLVKEQDENGRGTEANNVVMDRKGKKVRFSPEHELIEFTRSPRMKRRSRRNSVFSRNSSLSVDSDDGELREGGVEKPGRVLRLRGKIVAEGAEDTTSKRGRKRVKVENRRNEEATDNADGEELIAEIVGPGRCTRSRGQKLTEASVKKENRGIKVVKSDDNVALVSAEVDENTSVVGEGGKNNGKGRKEVPENKKPAGAHAMVEPQISLRRRSKRNTNRVGQSEILNDDTSKHMTGGIEGLRKTSILLEAESSGVDAESSKSKVDPAEGVVLQTEKPTELELRRSNRRRSVLASQGQMRNGELKAETENKYPLRSSVPQSGTTVGVSKDDKKVPQPTGILRRSRRKTMSVEPIPSDDKFDTDTSEAQLEAADEDSKAEKKVPQPTGAMRRSRRKTVTVESIPSDDKFDIDTSELHLEAADGDTKDEKKVPQPTGVVRRSRRRTMSVKPVPSDDKFDTDTSELQLEAANGDSKDEKKVPQPIGVTRRSKRKPLSLKLVSGDEKSDTDAAVENFVTDKHLTKPCLVEKGTAVWENTRGSRRNASKYKSMETSDEFCVDSIIQQKDEARKRRRGPNSGDVINIESNPSPLTQFMRKERKSEIKAAPAAAMSEVAGKPPSRQEGASMLDASSHEGLLVIGESLFVDAQQSVSEDAECVDNSDRISKNIISDVGPTSSRKTYKKNQEVSTADSAGSAHTIVINGDEMDNTDETAASRIAELKTDCTDSERQKTASKLRDVENAHLLEFEVQELVGQNISHTDKNDCEAQLFNQTKDSSCNNTTDNQVFLEGSIVSGNVGSSETRASVDSPLPGEPTDLKTNSEVTEAEPDKDVQPSLDVVDNVCEVKGISVQEDLDFVETEHAYAMRSPFACHHNDVDHLESSTDISENNNRDIALKVGDFESFDGYMDSTDLKSPLQLNAPSSGRLSRSLKGDKTPEEDETCFHKVVDTELAENVKDGCLKHHKSASNEDSEFKLADLFDVEKSARIIPQDREIFSGENSDMNSAGQGMYNDSLTVSPITIDANRTETDEGGTSKAYRDKCPQDEEFTISSLFDAERRATITPQDRKIFTSENPIKNAEQGMFHDSPSITPTTTCNFAEIELWGEGHEADHTAEGDKNYVCKDIQSDLAESNEVGHLRDHKSTRDEDVLLGVSDLFDAERSVRIKPQDSESYFAFKDSNLQGLFHDFPAVSSMCTDHNDVNISEGSSSLQKISPAKPNSFFGSEDLVSGSVPINGTCELIDKEAGAADAVQEKEAAIFQSNIPGEEVVRTIGDREHEIFIQAEEHTNNESTEPASEQTKSPVVEPTAVANTIHMQEAWSIQSDIAEDLTSMFKTREKGKTSAVIEGSNTADDAHDANCGKDKEDIADTCISDLAISMGHVNSTLGVEREFKFQDVVETEYHCKNQLAGHSVSDVGEKPNVDSSSKWTEIELNNLFGTPGGTPTRPNDGSSQEAETASLMNKSNTKNCSSLTKKAKIEMEGEVEGEGAKTTSTEVTLPAKYGKVSDSETDSNGKENQLKLLFATPIKIVTPCKASEISAHDRKLERAAISFDENVDTAKENVATDQSGEKVGDAGHEHNLCLDSLSDNGEDVTNEELYLVESVELVNTRITTVLSEAENNDGFEASMEQLTGQACECMKETNSTITQNEEEQIISLGQSCLNEEAKDNGSEWREKNIISLSGSPRNLDKPEGSRDMLKDGDLSENLSCGYSKSEGRIVQTCEFELSDADFQKSDIPEDNIHDPTACDEDGDILRETSIYNLRAPLDPEVANIGSLGAEKDVINKGNSPNLFSKTSNEDDKVTERKSAKSIREDDDPHGPKVWDQTDGNPRSPRDVLHELHTDTEVAVSKSLSVSYTLFQEADKLCSTIEPQSTSKETKRMGSTTQNVENIVPAAGDNENGDIEKSEAETPLLNSECDPDMNGEEGDSNPKIIKFPILELHLEEKFVDFNNDTHASSDVPSSGCNEILKESDVADTIKEYIDSESSLSVDFEDSGASVPINVLAHIDERPTCENAALCDPEEDIDRRITNSESLEAENKELEDTTLLMEPASRSEKAVKSPASVDLLVEGSSATEPSDKTKGEVMLFKEPAVEPKIAAVVHSGSAVNDTALKSRKQIDTSELLCSNAKRNARTILIHGTPGKLLATADMKENAAPTHRSSNIGDFTTARPAKRRALQDVQWK